MLCHPLKFLKLLNSCLYDYIVNPKQGSKISVNTDISVIGFYGNIKNIGKISVDIFTKISVIKIFHILNI